mgnify:FL=1
MHIEELMDYVLQFEDVTEGFPFGEEVLVFKVQEKIFLLLPLSSQPLQFNVKCDPDKAIELRELYPDAILPGFHMNKRHWNTVVVDGTLPKKLLQEMLTDSYNLVKKKSGKKK